MLCVVIRTKRANLPSVAENEAIIMSDSCLKQEEANCTDHKLIVLITTIGNDTVHLAANEETPHLS